MNNKKAKDIMTTEVIVANKNDIIANVASLLIKEIKFFKRNNILRRNEEV